MDNYKLDAEFPENVENLSGSEVPINAFILWNNLRFDNYITDDTDEILGESRTSAAGIELNLPFDTPFSLFIVHGINAVGVLVCWLFVNREMAITFIEKELTESKLWEIKDIQLEDMRMAGGIPELITPIV